MPPLKFETALSRLEEVVKSLENGDLPLEEALKVFEEGVRLSKNCAKMLEEAERKVGVLTQDKEAPLLDLKEVPSEGAGTGVSSDG